MIIISSDIKLPFPVGTMIYGSTANTVLPDPSFSQFQIGASSILLNKTIGDDLLISSNLPTIKKVYSILGDVIYEYTLFPLQVTGLPYYTPISVKRYDMTNPYTFSYVRGLMLALDSLRGTRDYTIVSATALMKSFSGRPISFIDAMFSIELPNTISMLLEDLGSYAYGDMDNSVITLKLAFESIAGAYDELLAADKPQDYLSFIGCREDNIVSENALRSQYDCSSCAFYEQYALERNNWIVENAHNFLKLDMSVAEFGLFQMTNILNELYQLPYSDISIALDAFGNVEDRATILFGLRDRAHVPLQTLLTFLKDNLVHYNTRHLPRINKLTLTKDWLDHVILNLYMQDGTNRQFYLNMALYHLYSPSIIRLHPC